MSERDDLPYLNFFRATPEEMLAYPPLASSLQSFETCLLLIGLQRYPAALIMCVNALESVIKAKLRISPEDRVALYKLLELLRSQFPSLSVNEENSEFDLVSLREKRNNIVHYGFSPRDDVSCAALLIETGLPFLELCYEKLFGFFLDWRRVDEKKSDFMQLSKEQMKCVGLLPDPDIACQFRSIRLIKKAAKNYANYDPRACLIQLSHFIRLGMKESSMSRSDWHVVDTGNDGAFEYQLKAKSDIERQCEAPFALDCPICQGIDTAVTDLDWNANGDNLRANSCQCVACGFFASKQTPYVAQAILASEISQKESKIRLGYGLR